MTPPVCAYAENGYVCVHMCVHVCVLGMARVPLWREGGHIWAVGFPAIVGSDTDGIC